MNQIGNRYQQAVGRWVNNRLKNTHLPFRPRERATLRFRQMKAPSRPDRRCSEDAFASD